MDGIHDVGGKQGYGPIEVTDDDCPFPTDWEARAYGIAKSVTVATDFNVDKFRYTREQLPPLEFLTARYFEQWMRVIMAMLVGSGLVTTQELAKGHSEGSLPEGVGAPKSAEAARASANLSVKFDGPYNEKPRFLAGDKVRVSSGWTSGHTRVPQYVRGRAGQILAYRGAHSVPDDNVKNIKTFEPLYTVAFSLGELFDEHRDSADEIHVEIWERFLAPTK